MLISILVITQQWHTGWCGHCYFALLTFITDRQRSCGKVMFSVVSVILLEGRRVPSVQGPRPPPPYRGLVLRPHPYVQGISSLDMFKLVQLGPHCTRATPSPEMFKFVHFEALTVRKWAVAIRLKCLLGTIADDFFLSFRVTCGQAEKSGCSNLGQKLTNSAQFSQVTIVIMSERPTQ